MVTTFLGRLSGNSKKVAELTLPNLFVRDHVGSLDVHAFPKKIENEKMGSSHYFIIICFHRTVFPTFHETLGPGHSFAD